MANYRQQFLYYFLVMYLLLLEYYKKDFLKDFELYLDNILYPNLCLFYV